MRNLIKFAIAYAIVLSEADVEQLGYDVTEKAFKEYFEIADDAKPVEAGKFNPGENAAYMNDKEAKLAGDKFKTAEAKAKGVAKPEKVKDDAKKAKADAKAKEAKPKKEKPVKEPKVTKVCNWKRAATLTYLGLHPSQILPFTEGGKESTILAECRKAKNKNNGDWAKGVYDRLKDEEKAEIQSLLEQGKVLPITKTEDEIKAEQKKADAEAKAKAKEEAKAKKAE